MHTGDETLLRYDDIMVNHGQERATHLADDDLVIGNNAVVCIM